MRRPATLRNVLSVAAVVVVLLVVTAAVSLVFATSVRQSTRSEIEASIESVRAIEECEVNLLLHTRARDAAERHRLEVQVRNLLDESALYAITDAEKRAFDDARIAVDHYFAVTHEPAATPEALREAESRAIAALERLAEVDVAIARMAQDRALHLSRMANIGAILFGIAILVITGGLVLWLRRRVIRPLFTLADTMKRFGAGERDVRAPAEGATELREMTQRFNDMADSLAAQRQAQIAFLGGVAHDLKNPLSALKLAVSVVDSERPLPAEPQLRRTMALMSRQVSQIDRMVGDFLELAKLESGEFELQIETQDICEIVQSSLDLFDATVRSRIRATLPDHPVLVSCDAVRIGQAVTNLVSNAIKYSPRDTPVEVRVTALVADVTVEVTDHGAGIARDELPYIFEPFQRGTAVKTDVPGTGLGLFNVRRIVRAHHGDLDVESTPGQGSTFRIRLALARPPELPAAKPQQAFRN